MEVLAMIFAIFAIAAAAAATILVGMVAGSIWGALAFAALLVLVYRAFSDQTGRNAQMGSDQLNAFQQPLTEVPGRPARDGHRNKAYRKHLARKARG